MVILGIVLSTSADKTYRLWDVNSSSINSAPIFASPKNSSDILSADWSKHDQNIFALGNTWIIIKKTYK